METHMFRVLYFAWLRQKIGIGEEKIHPPSHITTPATVVEWLIQRDKRYKIAFADLSAIKVAVNQEFASFDTDLNPGDEVAFFPPVTGG